MDELSSTLIWFAVLIVPGFLFVRGYFRGRSRIAPEQPLYFLAQAVVVSLLLVAAGWWLGCRHVAHWAEHHTLSRHEGYAYRTAILLLLVPFPLGLLVGGIIEWLIERLMTASAVLRPKVEALRVAKALPKPDRKPAVKKARKQARYGSALLLRVLEILEQRELLDEQNAWNKTWRRLRRDIRDRGEGAFVMVRVRTKSGEEVTAGFGANSWAAFRPHPEDLYVEQVFRPVDENDPTGPYAAMEDGLGMFFAANEIEAVEFRGTAATIIPPTDPGTESADPA
jgi:hypothetical protein